jgi:hypothetical protein
MKGKLALWILSLALLAPAVFAHASSVDFSNSGGTLTGTNTGLNVTGSILVGINSVQTGLITGNLGTVEFSTGALIGGDLQMGGTFAPGGTFTITGNGTDGIPNGVIFSGTFDAPAQWTLVTLANGTHNYTLQGSISGTWFTGVSVSGATVELTINVGKGFFNGQTNLASGDTNINGPGISLLGVPEPGTLGLLGTGLLGIGGLVRRKLS